MAENLILIGGIYHPFAEASAALAECLEDVGINSTVTLDIEGGLERLAAGDRFDLLTIYALRFSMTQHEKYGPYRDEWAFSLTEAGQTAIRSHVESGGGLLALHTASICFDNWREWGDVLGGAWDWSRSFHPEIGSIHVDIATKAHSIVSGIGNFGIHDEIYHYLDPRPDVEPLLTAEATKEDGPQTISWARRFGKGRVVYDGLGHDAASVNNPTHQRILKRAALWTLDRPNEEIQAI